MATFMVSKNLHDRALAWMHKEIMHVVGNAIIKGLRVYISFSKSFHFWALERSYWTVQ